MSRAWLILGVVLVCVVGLAQPAAAGGVDVIGSGNSNPAGDGAEAVLFVGERQEVLYSVPAPAKARGAKWTCGYYLVLSDVTEGFTPGLGFQNLQRATPEKGGSYWLICTDESGARPVERLVEDYNPATVNTLLEDPGTPTIDLQAVSVRIDALKPQVRTSPPADQRQIVNVRTWFWVDTWNDLEATATIDGFTISLRARPVELIIDPGDGSPEVRCTRDMAIAWREGGPKDTRCGHRYFKKSGDEPGGVFHAKARMRYEDVTWSVAGPAGPVAGAPLPEITSGDTDLPLVVHQIQAVIN